VTSLSTAVEIEPPNSVFNNNIKIILLIKLPWQYKNLHSLITLFDARIAPPSFYT
jgi:hypothetical protein